MNRKEFLRLCGFSTLGLILDFNFPSQIWAKTSAYSPLILIELYGGNDGLNTVIPYNDEHYYQLRPRLAIEREQVIQLNSQLGLHPSMKELLPLWKRNEMAIVNGVGYAQPNRSHFRSIDIWNTASDSHEYLEQGWICLMAQSQMQALNTHGVVLGRDDPGPLSGARTLFLNNPQQFLNQAERLKQTNKITQNQALQHILNTQNQIQQSSAWIRAEMEQAKPFQLEFPNSSLGNQLKSVAGMIAAKVDIPVFKLSLGSFDTHTQQRVRHHNLLKELSEGIVAFKQSMLEINRWNEVMIMTYSEFGRRPAENANGGTDHGTAAPHFVWGGKVKGGFYGSYPSLNQLSNNDLIYSLDYRSLYATILAKKWRISPTSIGLNQPVLPFL
jgi:uncharacterized protein (DUF1501 family)